MIIVRFPDSASEKRALGFLAGRFNFTTRASGETLVSEMALPLLAAEGVAFHVEGVASYDLQVPAIRNRASA